MVFFRDQHLDHAQQIAFGAQFGELTYAHPHDDAPPEEHPEIYTVDPDRFEERYGEDFRKAYRARQYSYFNGWHTDVTAAVNPPAGSILRADVVPEFGGDTQWTNLVAAYEGLSEPVQGFVETPARRAPLRRRHGRRGRRPTPSGSRTTCWSRSTRWCGCTRSPGRGRCSSTRASPATSSTSPPRESKAILDLLYAEITRPEYTVRFRWEPGSVAFWDNRATAHLAPRDIEHLDVQRTLHRVTLIGEVPVGPDGRESELVAGQPFTDKHKVVVAAAS